MKKLLEVSDDKVALIFTGQGFDSSQLTDIRYLLQRYPLVSEMYEECFQTRFPSILDKQEVKRNEVSCALLLLSSLYQLDRFRDSAGETDLVAGYSVGQFVALHAAGALNVEELLFLVFKRCQIMNSAALQRKGRMLTILGLPYNEIIKLVAELRCKGCLDISNDNAPGNITVAGDAPLMRDLAQKAQQAGAYKTVFLETSGAWHCEHMAAGAGALSRLLDGVTISPTRVRLVGNSTGQVLGATVDEIKAELVRHLSSAVLWKQSVKCMLDLGCVHFLEVSHFDMLSKIGPFISRKARFQSAGAL